MRNISPSAGETRVREWFAILPVVIQGEQRWLETVLVEEEYANAGEEGWIWLPRKFLNKE